MFSSSSSCSTREELLSGAEGAEGRAAKAVPSFLLEAMARVA